MTLMQRNIAPGVFQDAAADVVEIGGGVGRGDEHSRMGIASCVLSVIVGVLAILSIVAAGVLVNSTPAGAEDSPLLALVGVTIIGCMFASLAGLGLGIAGLVQRSRKKLFTILGAIGNGLVFLGILGIIVLGLTL